MPHFRKRPVVIEAVQLTAENHDEVATWCGGSAWTCGPTRAVVGLIVLTHDGTLHAEYGDWIVRGVLGKFSICKPDLFAATYEAAEPDNGTRT